ncbi:serine hydrolase [Virgibacillus halodenitrificans]|uniref:serine hydrolase n=1 Tax=Virgibacillus halodenitrificans TaxID=1482 RepID=UPI0002EEE6E8|nr:serine hydrolase [Virgibacillus halodenitrificans]
MFLYIFISIGIVVLLLVMGFFWLSHWTKKPDADYVLKFIAKNPERASLSVIKNGKSLVNVQSNRLLSLASTVKIIIAIEYAQQAAHTEIDPAERIKTDDLACFYIPGTDGGAHEAWLKTMEEQGRLQNGTVSLVDIAKGMISHSSNANTEFLIMWLGLDKINANLEKLQLSSHEQIYPFVSALFIPYEIAHQKKLDIHDKKDAKKIAAYIEDISQTAYIEESIRIHDKLIQDIKGDYKNKVNIKAWHNIAFDRLVSKRFVRSTASEYVSIVRRMNEGVYFSSRIWEQLQPIMEWPMNGKRNQRRFKSLGGKGGSTAYILTYAFYAEDKQGNKTELAVFFNDIYGYETVKLSNSSSVFQSAVLTDSPDWDNKLKNFLDR